MVTSGLTITTGVVSDDRDCSYNPYSGSGIPGDRFLHQTANLVPHHIGISDVYEYDAVVAMEIGSALAGVMDSTYTAPSVRQCDPPLAVAVAPSKQ